MPENIKHLHWVGSSKKDLLTMPPNVVDGFGYVRERLKAAQMHAKGV
jgi:phage-related protein